MINPVTDDLVSIITPAYKAERFVGEAIESVIAQDYGNWEMIVVDDRSPDDTGGVVERYAKNEPRVRLIRQPENAGPASARNAALDAGRGRFVAFLDSDDRWMAGKLRQQLAFMSANAAVFSFTSFRRISETGDKVGHLIRAPERLDYRALLTNTAIATSSVIIDRAATGSFRMTKTYYDDFVLWLEILKRGHVAHGLDADLLRYRVLGQSVSRNKVNSSRWVWRTYREIEGLDPISAARCFVSYAWHAGLKYRKF